MVTVTRGRKVGCTKRLGDMEGRWTCCSCTIRSNLELFFKLVDGPCRRSWMQSSTPSLRLKKMNLKLDVTYSSIINLDIHLSRFVGLGYVIFNTRLVFYGTEGVLRTSNEGSCTCKLHWRFRWSTRRPLVGMIRIVSSCIDHYTGVHFHFVIRLYGRTKDSNRLQACETHDF
jgi:hypothetical protein